MEFQKENGKGEIKQNGSDKSQEFHKKKHYVFQPKKEGGTDKTRSFKPTEKKHLRENRVYEDLGTYESPGKTLESGSETTDANFEEIEDLQDPRELWPC
jgi:hypothetical protein